MEDLFFENEDFCFELSSSDSLVYEDYTIDTILSPSFHGNSRIDELYDPHLDQVQENFMHHLEDFKEAETPFEVDRASRDMQNDLNSARFWENAKREAELQAEKDKIFLDDINARLDIAEHYRKLLDRRNL